MKIFTFSWNTQSLILTNPEFVKDIKKKCEDCDIVIISLQEDNIRYSNIIQDFEKALQIKLIDLVELSGWGITTYKNLVKNWDYAPRGLRMAVFAKESVCITDSSSYSILCPGLKEKITWGKGCVVTDLTLIDKKISIVNCHLPFSSKSLRENRKDALDWQVYCFKYLWESVMLNKPDILFFMGDFNFRVDLSKKFLDTFQVTNDMLQGNFKEYLVFDELTRLKNTIHFPVYEEPDINFLPTCKMLQYREPDHFPYKIGKWKQRVPSWCDRILYRSAFNIECEEYNSYEEFEIIGSDHKAVYAIFKLDV